MSEFTLAEGDEYDKQCGEVFLTLNGCLLFHCTLCDQKYKGIKEYAQHIIALHYEPLFLEGEEELSSHSSDFLDYEENVEIKEEQLDGLQEEEIPISVIKENKPKNQIVTAVPVLDESEPDIIVFKWEEAPEEEYEVRRPPIKKQRITHLPARLLPKPAAKPLTEAEKIRMANEEALISMGNQPTFKQPIARGDIPDSERKHKCNFCGFAFKDPSNLIAHIKRHSDKRNYQCAYCPKMFCTRTEIDEHSRRHTGERPFSCEFENCGKAYFTRSELNAHKKRHLNQRNYKCEICDRSFFDKGDLREHMVSHTQERNHECIVCHGKFSRRKALLNHMKLHENKREYECELCNASFNQRPGLNSHMRSKHKEHC